MICSRIQILMTNKKQKTLQKVLNPVGMLMMIAWSVPAVTADNWMGLWCGNNHGDNDSSKLGGPVSAVVPSNN